MRGSERVEQRHLWKVADLHFTEHNLAQQHVDSYSNNSLVLVFVLLCLEFRIAFNPMTVLLTLEVDAPKLHQTLPKHELKHSV